MTLPYSVLITKEDVLNFGGYDLENIEKGFHQTIEDAITQFLNEVARSIYYLVKSNRGTADTNLIFADTSITNTLAEAQLYEAIYIIQEGHQKEMAQPSGEFHSRYAIDVLEQAGIIRRAVF